MSVYFSALLLALTVINNFTYWLLSDDEKCYFSADAAA